MNIRSLYIAHPFDARKRVRAWEQGFESRTGIVLNNPFYDAPDRADVEEIDTGRAERYEKLNPMQLVRKDLRYILSSDAVIALIDGSISYGTIMEIVYACIHNLPVYLVITNGHHGHPWLVYHSTVIFTSLIEFEEYACREF